VTVRLYVWISGEPLVVPISVQVGPESAVGPTAPFPETTVVSSVVPPEVRVAVTLPLQ